MSANVDVWPEETAFRLLGIDMNDVARALYGKSPYGGGYVSWHDVNSDMWCIAEQLEAGLLVFLDEMELLGMRP